MSVVFDTNVTSRWREAYQRYERAFTQALADSKPTWREIAQIKNVDTLRLLISWFDNDSEWVEDTGAVPGFNFAERRLDVIVIRDFVRYFYATKSQLRDDITGVVDRAVNAAMAAADLWNAKVNSMCWGVINNSETTLCWNGQNLVDTAHPVNVDRSDWGTQSNLESGAALSGTTLNNARVKFRQWKNSQNVYIESEAKPTLWVPEALSRTANQLANDEFYTPTTTQGVHNTTGASRNDQMGSFVPRSTPWLTSTTAAFLIMPMADGRAPVILADRQQPELEELGPDSEYYILNSKSMIKHTARTEAVAGYPDTIVEIRP